MPNVRLSMRKIQEILRLKFELSLSNRQIARSCSISHSTVADYVRRFRDSGLSWPLPEEVDHTVLQARMFSASCKAPRSGRPVPDWAAIHEERRRYKHVTLQLLWQEYKQTYPDGYQYSQFCDRYHGWRRKLDLVLRQEHRAGEKMFVDYAGQTVPVMDSKTGEISGASIFVAVLGASNYSFVEASLQQDVASWISVHVHALEYFGGSPAVVVPDNTRTGVTRACRYEPDLNATYAEMAKHYGMAVIPARPRKPRDKAKVEAGVLVVERWILATLRKRTFFSLGELNQAIGELLEVLNHRPFRKLQGSRAEQFKKLDRPALRALPVEPYTFAEWKKARVNIDYHVELNRYYYSVPYVLVGRQVEIRFTATTLEIFHQGQRVASHQRTHQVGGFTTVEAHRPECHQRYLEWTPSRLINWASKTGSSTAALVEKILSSRRYPEQSYRSCLGLLRLGKSFGEDRLEAACTRALKLNACSYKSVKSILQTGLDRQPLPDPSPERSPLLHSNLRGPHYFDSSKGGSYVH